MKPQNQTLLALIITAILVSGFFGVSYVAEKFSETSTIETMYVSDSDLVFSEIDTTDTAPLIPQPYTIASYKYAPGTPPPAIYKHNCTPVYSGNNTWAASMTGWNVETPQYGSAFYFIPIDIPAAKTFIARNITINTTLPNELVHISLVLGGYNNPQDSAVPPGIVLSNQVPYSTGHYEATYVLTDYNALQWYNIAQNCENPNLSIYIYDIARDGLSSFALEISVEITGVIVTTWSLQNSVNLVLGISIGLNIFLIAYMNDSLDFNAVRKDLPGKTRAYFKRKKSRKNDKWRW